MKRRIGSVFGLYFTTNYKLQKIILSSDCYFLRKGAVSKGGYDVILNQEGVRHMSVQGSSTQNNQEKFNQEKTIVSAVIKYFEAAPSRQSKAENTESAVINAFYRYFDTKLPQDYSK
jgi:hypothetical protein